MRADQLARQLLAFGKVVPIEEVAEKVDAVDRSAVSGAVQPAVSPCEPPAFAAVGAVDRLASYERVAAQFGQMTRTQ